MNSLTPSNKISGLPASMRKKAAESKYAEAVILYASSDLTIRQVAERCNVTASGLSAHIGKYHRVLLFHRYGLDINDETLRKIKVKQPKGQSYKTYLKYRAAIEACGDMAYIEFNISQIARLFGLDGPALAAQLRVHYPGVIENRESIRQRYGIADNTYRGPRPWSAEAYSEAMQMYKDTDMTISEVAERCNVSKSGLCQFMRFYHKDILNSKADRRKASAAKNRNKKPGYLAGNGHIYGPKPETVALYAPALELYLTTTLTVNEIIAATGVPSAGFKGYLHRWYRGEKLKRSGLEWDGDRVVDLRTTPHYLPSAAGKYAAAIDSIRNNPRPIAEVAKEFGHNPEVFREYLKKHEPELACQQGMVRLHGGKLVKRSAVEKYGAAIEEYKKSTDTLKSISARHGIVYNSIVNFITRNCPEVREIHNRLVEQASLASQDI